MTVLAGGGRLPPALPGSAGLVRPARSQAGWPPGLPPKPSRGASRSTDDSWKPPRCCTMWTRRCRPATPRATSPTVMDPRRDARGSRRARSRGRRPPVTRLLDGEHRAGPALSRARDCLVAYAAGAAATGINGRAVRVMASSVRRAGPTARMLSGMRLAGSPGSRRPPRRPRSVRWPGSASVGGRAGPTRARLVPGTPGAGST